MDQFWNLKKVLVTDFGETKSGQSEDPEEDMFESCCNVIECKLSAPTEGECVMYRSLHL
jgi:hypothetical protein